MEAVNFFKNVPVQTADVKKASGTARDFEGSDNAKKMKVARDFESILIGQLMNQMKETIGESGFLEDGSSGQVRDMFWSFLADEVGRNGGFGMWKNIYKSMSPDPEQVKDGQGSIKPDMKLDHTA